MSANCKACGTALLWALSKNGKPSPIVAEPVEGGNVLLFRQADELRYAVVPVPMRGWFEEQGIPLRVNHFGTCPDAARFR